MVVRFICYFALYAAIAIMLSMYIPDALAAVGIVVGVVVTYLAALYGKRFRHRVTSVYGGLMWASGLLLLFYLTYYSILSGVDAMAYVLYAVFVVFGVSAAAVVGAKEYAAVLQNVRVDYVLLGVVCGIVVAWFAYSIPCSILPIVGLVETLGPAGSLGFDLVTAVFVVMLFVVAIPEEFMARLFAFHIGGVTVDLFSGGLAATVLGYALHAITRYSNPSVLLVVTLVWALITAFYAFTRSLIGSIMFHAVYNTVVVFMYVDVLATFLVSLAIAAACLVFVVKGVGNG
jgi:membrane protease YdiL (CAAX protease family)